MKKTLLSTISLAAFSASAVFAADLPSIKSAPVVAPVPLWTGFYAGLNSGYNFGANSNSYTTGYGPGNFTATDLTGIQNSFSYPMTGVGLALTGTANNNQSGFIGGGQIGYNYQIQHKFIVGIEADIQGAGIGGGGGFTGAGVNGSTVSGTSYSANSSGQTSTSSFVNWLGTVRGRLGYLLTPTFLAYGTGGLSYGGVKSGVSQNVYTSYIGLNDSRYPFEGSQNFLGNSVTSQTLVGWNVGGGFEWMFMPNWSLKGEAIYWNLGNVDLSTTSIAGAGGSHDYAVPGEQEGTLPKQVSSSTTSINYQGIIARAGINYHFDPGSLTETDLVSRHSIKDKKIEAAADFPLWSYFYAGLNSGYNFGTNTNSYSNGYEADSLTQTRDGLRVSPFNYSLSGVGFAQTGKANNLQSGFIGGGQVGYNYQLNQNFVVGIETDIQGSGIEGSGGFTGAGINSTTVSGINYSANSTGQASISSSVNWIGTVRGRLGYLLTPSLLAYGTGGLSYGGVKAAVSSNVITNYIGSKMVDLPFQGSQSYFGNSVTSQTLVGWNVGGGFEWMFMPNWSLKGEAIYWNLGNVNLSTTLIAGPGGSFYYYIPNQQRGVLPNQVSSSTTTINYQGVIARAGVNYHFNLASVPVVAKF